MTGRMGKAACVVFTLVLTMCGLFAAYVEGALADQAQTPPARAETIADGVTCAPGQAIACVSSGYETQLAQVADSVEFLLMVDGNASGCGPCELVLVKSSSRTVEDLVSVLEACEGVVFAEPDYRAEPQAEGAVDLQAGGWQTATQNAATRPDYTGRQYAYNGEFGLGVPNWNSYDDGGHPTPSVSAAGKVVAVLDTGVDYNHEDLRGAMWSEGEYHPALVALGGGKHGINVSVPRGDKTPYNTTDPMDDATHGTHVAGIIAGEWNGLGISGVACYAKIMAVKVMNDEGAMDMSSALRGYRYVIAAQKAGVDVVAINNSWGYDVYSKSLDMAVREAGGLGAVSTFAAGNERRDIDIVGQVTNAFINNPYVVMVGNSDKNGQMAESSSFGKRSVGVFAPGQDIFSTVPTGAGPADETADPLVTDGITYACDYESTTVQDNADNSAFGFRGDEDTALTIADEGHGASMRSLNLTATAGETLTVSMGSKMLTAQAECRGLCLWMKAPAAKLLDCVLICETADEMSEEFHVMLDQASSDWRLVAFPITSKFNMDGLKLSLMITVHEWQGSPDGAILIDDVKLVSATSPYAYDTGTSMASPATAGCAAVLAAAFPDDDAAKRAARVVGSVKPVASLADQCVSGGIFRLDKALAQDTNPVLNGASTQSGVVTIDGFFFGADSGSLSVDGQALTVLSWSDAAVVARLPGDFSPGEKLVEVTTSAGKMGHQRFRIGTPASLYQRLPLPGRTLSGDPGDYGIASSEFDESFYAAAPRALVGLGGSLYYLLETVNETTAIFRYDIDKRTWEQVYEGGYAPGGGACTWNGKILFVAGRSREDNTFFGLFDPASRTAKYSLYNDQCFERERTLVNTGKGILLAGGRKFVYGSSKELSIETVCTVDPESLRISPVTLPEGVSLPDSWYSGVYDEAGNGYLFCGTRMEGFYKFSFTGGGVTCTVLKNGPLYDEQDGDDALQAGGDAQSAHSASAAEYIGDYQDRNMVAGPTKNGIASSGPITTNDADVVIADTYSSSWGDTEFKATDKRMSVTKVFNPMGTTYRDRFYVIGASESEVGGWMFASQPVETFEQPGDVSPTSGNLPSPSSDSPPMARTLESKATANASTTPKARAVPSTTPKTGDVLFPAVSALALLSSLALVVAHRARKRSKLL